MLKIVRIILGNFILLLNAVFKPKALIRDESAQKKLDAETKAWKLYHLNLCPFCVKVRREMTRLAVHIPLREINDQEGAHAELMAGGKVDQVPCLYIPAGVSKAEQWIYESSEINELLRSRFTHPA